MREDIRDDSIPEDELNSLLRTIRELDASVKKYFNIFGLFRSPKLLNRTILETIFCHPTYSGGQKFVP